ncbi:MAG: penicillin-binding protein 2 [Acidobacteria bacterium]|jgi:cell division protein FtsI/penicillin-binding protein 2|nr:MAG: penicillin-binding protein 2 [Acidobacteriota bacterium]GIU82920.1 MAG: stage V sporulation protein D [Pyrinomonadaceae bacterium]
MQSRTSQKYAQMVSTRFLFVVAVFLIWFGGICFRLVHLQVEQHEFWRQKALAQRREKIVTKTLRGTIYDTSGRTLAMSIKAKSLVANPQEVEDEEKIAEVLASVLNLKAEDVLRDLKEAKNAGRRFLFLARKLDEAQVEKINELLRTDIRKADEPKFKGLYWQEEQKRYYPLGGLGAHVIGFSNVDDVGQAGIELSQEKFLRGQVVEKWQERDRLGRVYESDVQESDPPKDVYLTISASIQYKVEQALKEGVQRAKAKSGTAIVLNPKTGEILAMANYPTFDPNRYREFQSEFFANKAIQNVFSPGSIFKIVTYGAAVDKQIIVNPAQTISCDKGYIEIADRRFSDKHCKEKISYFEAIAVSSNLVAIKTAQAIGKEAFFHYIKAFGFGEKTGIELPAESAGLVNSPEKWSGLSLASTSIGYEIGVTALQMASAFAAIANDGVRVSPYIIKEIRSGDNVFYKPEVREFRVLSPEAARKLRQMLEYVVLEGTGKKALLKSYTAGGKTGTAWKYDEKLKRYNEAKYISSFIGFAPIENPSVVIAVVIDEPRVAARNGGDVAAPIFREIAEAILPEMKIPPDKQTIESQQAILKNSVNSLASLKNETTDYAKKTRTVVGKEKTSEVKGNKETENRKGRFKKDEIE